jgi:Putative prokaryotic signal transducing protein
MALRDPVAVYNAASNMEAHFVREALTAAGIEAFVIEDVSQVGTWAFGLIPEIHKPQVWVERADIARAKPVLEDYERRTAELRAADAAADAGPDIEAVCEECGGRSTFPAAVRGTVQTCRHCGEYLDVGGEEEADWQADAGEEREEA